MSRTATLAGLFLLFVYVPLSAADWPAFRGPVDALHRGRAEGTGYPQKWSKDENVSWRFPLPDAGNSSPVVAQGKVFVTCAENDGKLRHLFCVDAETGKQLWKQTVEYNKPEPTHKTNPYCGSSPAVGENRVVVWHGSAGIHCYSLDGEELWTKETGPIHHIWGHGSSPIIDEGMVYLNIGPGVKTYVTALSLEDGKTVWEVPEPGGNLGEKGPNGERAQWVGSWSTPQIFDREGRRQVICALPTRVIGYDAASGEILWYCEGLANLPRGNLVYTDPLIGRDVGVVLGGFKGPGIGFSLGEKGDITITSRLWKATRDNPQRIGSGLMMGDLVFQPCAGPNALQSLDVNTGEVLWNERNPQAFWGSMVLADGLIYVTDQSGTTLVLEPEESRLELKFKNTLGERSNSTPAFADGNIYLRTREALYRISN
jgi:outer membrane protein assembly factor BamB